MHRVVYKPKLVPAMPFMSIKTDTYPFLVFGESSNVMPWSHGTIFSLRMKSTYLRITRRGLQYSMSERLPEMSSAIWKSARCLPCMDGLCGMTEQAGSMLWFPSTQVDIPDNFELIPRNEYLDQFPNGSACTSSSTARSLLMRDTRYEVSLCDLLDSNLDVVYMREYIYWRTDTTGVLTYIVVSFACVYLVSCVSENIVNSMQGERQTVFAEQRATVYGSLLLICYVLFYEDCASLLLTSEDHSLMWHLLFYVGVQTVVQQLYAATVAHGARISLLTACIALLTLRVHYSFDNPYTLVLSVLFGTRSMFKFMSAVVLPHSAPQIALVLLDNFAFCSLLENGLMATNTERLLGTQTQVLVVLMTFLLAVAILAYTSRHPVTG